MTSRIAQTVLAFGRARVGSATISGANSSARGRLAFSTQISKSYATESVGPLNAFVRTWYNLYVNTLQMSMDCNQIG